METTKGESVMKGEMRIVRPYNHPQAGDERVEWDTEVQETVDTAKAQFSRLLLNGHVGFVTTGTPRKLEEFDPEAGRIVMTPPLSGG